MDGHVTAQVTAGKLVIVNAITEAPAPVLAGLPHRPRLLPGLPVLRRTVGETQIGVDPRYAVVISDAPDELAMLLPAVDGRDTLDDLLARAGPPHQRALAQALAGLAELGLVEDAAPAGRDLPARIPARLAADCTAWALRTGRQRTGVHAVRSRAAVAVYGNGRVASGVAALLAASGVGWVRTAADGVVEPEDIGCGYVLSDVGEPRRLAATRAVHRIASETKVERFPPRRLPDVAVLADAVVPDPGLCAGLSAAGVPQLVARAGDGVGVVGPLVVPGRTCCLRCVELHHTDGDPCWPSLATQLAAGRQQADLASAQMASAFAVGQVLQMLHGSVRNVWPAGGPAEERSPPDPVAPDPVAVDPPGSGLATWGVSVEIDVFTGQISRTVWEPHPRCSCGAEGTGVETEADDG